MDSIRTEDEDCCKIVHGNTSAASSFKLARTIRSIQHQKHSQLLHEGMVLGLERQTHGQGSVFPEIQTVSGDEGDQ